jgi:hypothetical protein
MTWTEALTVNGLVGGTVRIECTHTNAYTNKKYFCKGKCEDVKDVLISTSTRGSDRYSIKDNGNTFITTIRDPRLEDTGTYWCGIHRFLLDTYVKVYLKVNKGKRIPFLYCTCIFYFFAGLSAQHTSAIRRWL